MIRVAGITDATLREGMQTVTGTFTAAQSVEVAGLLAGLGVDMVECGHPQLSHAERERVNAVVKAVRDVPVLTHARLRREDIESAARSGAAWVGVFVGINDLSQGCRTGWQDLDATLGRVPEAVALATELGLRMRFTIEDASRTAWERIELVLDLAVAAGVARICLADSVGAMEPGDVGKLFGQARSRWPDIDIEGHFHDDRGLALANSLAAIDAGATFIATSVNSLGERAGITDLAAFMVNQHVRAGAALPKPGRLQDVSERVAAYSRSAPDARRPVVGRDVFRHASRLHVRAVSADPAAYEILDPHLLGRDRSVGQAGVVRDLDSLVVTPPVISATELRHHRHGPGDRYVLIDDRLVPGAGQYCIARRIPAGRHPRNGHVDTHQHQCDSLFGFLGDGPGYSGLSVEVWVGDKVRTLNSPASVFIPAGEPHSYRAVEGSGTYLNHVLSGSYEASLLDPVEHADPASETISPIIVNNPKAEAWNEIGHLFWTKGRVSARPSQNELELYCGGVGSNDRICVVGASTLALVVHLLEDGARVTILDFSSRMCRDLVEAVHGADIRLVDITGPIPQDLAGVHDLVLSDRLVNRFSAEEASRGVAGMAALLRPGGMLRASVKLGLYPMDESMLEHARLNGTPPRFWDETTSTIDFSLAGESLTAGMVPHGSISSDLLKAWYIGRGREKRFDDGEVRALLADAGLDLIGVLDFPDAPHTRLYSARRGS